ncbi:MAG: hypothetical protein KDD25_09155, partial [Bdellovibrionales bacterium]|nr:hypothetical protein [Bdellovibrionales bacterium]
MPSKLFAVVFASIAAFCGLLSKAESASMFPKKLNLDPPQHLLIGLDGIGYDIFLEMYRGGHFQDFKRPARMVASFPSISDPNWSRIMGTDVEESYT